MRNPLLPPRGRPAQVLVEFALVAFILFLLLFVIIELSRAIFVAQTIQQAADVTARDLARTPLPPSFSFEQALDDPEVRLRVYDDRMLVIDIEKNDIETVWPRLPAANQQLRGLMLPPDPVRDNGRLLVRFPGRLVLASKYDRPGLSDKAPLPLWFEDSGWRVVVETQENGGPVECRPVLAEVAPGGAFSLPRLDSNELHGGNVRLQFNYPYASAARRDGSEQPYPRLLYRRAVYRREIFGPAPQE